MKVSKEWIQRLFEAFLYHEGTNDLEGIYWPVAKSMLKEKGIEVEGDAPEKQGVSND